MRAVSTVLDVSVCLLLVGASVATLVGTPTDPRTDPDTADARAETLTTTTARVTYADGDGRRSVHDTLAGLLSGAAVADARNDAGTRPAAFERAVTHRINRTLRRSDAGVQVLVTWRPFAGSSIRGRVVAGDVPPPDTDLHAATVVVASGLPDVRPDALAAADREGFEGVARAVAAGIVPTSDTRPLADEFEADLRAEFRTPTAAARSVSVARARVTVRTWSE